MTAPSIGPAGNGLLGLNGLGKGKGKAEVNPMDPAFAYLLAMLMPGGQAQGVPLPTGEGTTAEAGAQGIAGSTFGQTGTEQASPEGLPLTQGQQNEFPQVLDFLQGQQPAEAEQPQVDRQVQEIGLTGIDVQRTPANDQTIPAPAEVVATAQLGQEGGVAPATMQETTESIAPVRPEALVESEPTALEPDEKSDSLELMLPVDPTKEPEEPERSSDARRENMQHNDPDQVQGSDQHAQAGESPTTDAPGAERFSLPPASQAQQGSGTAETQSSSPVTGGLDSLRGRFEPGRVMDAVSRSLANTPDGDYTVTLQLHPERLGEMRLRIHLSGNEVQAVMEVASAEARQALQAQSQQLRQNLDQVGLTLANFEVSTGQNQQQTPQERRDAFQDMSPGRQGNGRNQGGRPMVQPVTGPAEAIDRIRNAGRRGARLDTMA